MRSILLRSLPLAICGLLLLPVSVRAQDPATNILQVLADQQNAWNRGDIPAFMHGYDDSPTTTFIGKSVEHGYAMILARYQRAYATKDAMGVLKFSDLDVRMLGTDHAVVTGHFHLERTQAGGGEASGIFSLIFEKEPDGWKIILDHTSTT
jgi:ketosteroid isomerase-like protein